jgi:hypothetical protein
MRSTDFQNKATIEKALAEFEGKMFEIPKSAPGRK